MQEKPIRIIVTGSIAYDYIMSFPGAFSDHILPEKIDILSVSFLVDSLRREPGGCAANIGYNLALLGERPSVMATVGPDFAGDRERLAASGVDTSLIHTVDDHFTASFFVSTDQKNCQIASFYVGAMGAASKLSLHALDGYGAAERTDRGAAKRTVHGAAEGPVHEAVAEPPVVIISPNAPEAMTKYVAECKALGWPYIYDPSQQIVRLSGEELREGIAGSLVLMANEYEFELIAEKTGLTVPAVLDLAQYLIITHGESGSAIYADGTRHSIPAVPPSALVDPTGVGDAYRAGIVFGLLHQLPWPQAGRVAALAATYALEVLGTQGHSYTPQAFLDRYQTSFGEVPPLLRQRLGQHAEG